MEAFERAARLDPSLPYLDAHLGISYYELGEFERASERLDRALRQDPNDGPTLYFLALIDQRSGRHGRAAERFERAAAADPELSALAWYGAGRSQLELGNRAAADSALRRAIQADRDGAVARDARRLLEESEDRGRDGKRWSLRGSAGIEGDDNVTLSEIDVDTEEGDVAGVFELGFDARVLEWGESELEIGYDFYQSLYADLTEFNLRSHLPYASLSTRVSGFDPSLTYRFSHSALGGDAFLDTHTAAFALGRSLTGWWYASLGFELEGLVFEDDPRRDALRKVLAVEQLFLSRDRRHSFFLVWRLAGNGAEGAEFDYLGNTLRARLELPAPFLREGSRLAFGYEYLARDYDNVTPSIGERREDTRHSGRFGLRIPLVRHFDAVLEYTHIGAASNLPSQDYDENVVELRLEAWF